ncbi:hypothetical protein OG806_46180 [Streptomyces sp. NBC_00882]|uniref:hypothetical protein n=1 Tax=Streptomyces TaxID=1883 RepID=UPI0038639A66|nr:hypothetical protein OH837_03215 [Streptomyces canus]WSZ36288.1 hypothetical protein OG806_46180 [Streptomyces sp. NBC_00882]WSZ63214.1 hypothetical protein OH824_45045 [Streptomyces canus]
MELAGGGRLAARAVDHRSPERLAGQRVVVVSAGDSAVQIAADLATMARVTLAVTLVSWAPSRSPAGTSGAATCTSD